MHSFGYRANAVVTFAVTILAVTCAMVSLSDNFNSPSPTADVKVLNINWFQKQPNGNDEVSLTLNISADLSSLFTWNTKQVFVFVAAEYETPQNALNQFTSVTACSFVFVAQVSLWDGIIQSKEHAKFWIHTTNKYRFTDQARDGPFPLYLYDTSLLMYITITSSSIFLLVLAIGNNLRGKDYNMTLHWHIMPKTGKMFADKIVMTGYYLPQDYK
ncbi:hypothetical protein ZIOFF_065091 [Zingiber officinale]|uniref:Signal peptidase complex subunit 3 n=1 Tax=Zingiber officinale TaxID=94328 RepID=A0A8J5KB91_ZINOF|nr:hypothetical protein ZIOFF_065091 [Zingiber officinale]